MKKEIRCKICKRNNLRSSNKSGICSNCSMVRVGTLIKKGVIKV